MSKFIRIQSNTNINVMDKLYTIDMTNTDARVSEQLRVSPAWTKTCVLIKNGVGYYPAIMKNWSTVKSLVDRGVATVTDVDEVPEQYRAEAEEIAERLDSAKKVYKQRADSARVRSATKKEPEVGAIIEE